MLNGKREIHAHCYRQDEILMLLRVCEDFGIKLATLQHVLEGYKVADALAKHGVGASSFSDWWAYKIEAWDAIPGNGPLMQSQGVVVSYNSDDSQLASRLNWEAAKAVKFGALRRRSAEVRHDQPGETVEDRLVRRFAGTGEGRRLRDLERPSPLHLHPLRADLDRGTQVL